MATLQSQICKHSIAGEFVMEVFKQNEVNAS